MREELVCANWCVTTSQRYPPTLSFVELVIYQTASRQTGVATLLSYIYNAREKPLNLACLYSSGRGLRSSPNNISYTLALPTMISANFSSNPNR